MPGLLTALEAQSPSVKLVRQISVATGRALGRVSIAPFAHAVHRRDLNRRRGAVHTSASLTSHAVRYDDDRPARVVDGSTKRRWLVFAILVDLCWLLVVQGWGVVV